MPTVARLRSLPLIVLCLSLGFHSSLASVPITQTTAAQPVKEVMVFNAASDQTSRDGVATLIGLKLTGTNNDKLRLCFITAHHLGTKFLKIYYGSEGASGFFSMSFGGPLMSKNVKDRVSEDDERFTDIEVIGVIVKKTGAAGDGIEVTDARFDVLKSLTPLQLQVPPTVPFIMSMTGFGISGRADAAFQNHLYVWHKNVVDENKSIQRFIRNNVTDEPDTVAEDDGFYRYRSIRWTLDATGGVNSEGQGGPGDSGAPVLNDANGKIVAILQGGVVEKLEGKESGPTRLGWKDGASARAVALRDDYIDQITTACTKFLNDQPADPSGKKTGLLCPSGHIVLPGANHRNYTVCNTGSTPDTFQCVIEDRKVWGQFLTTQYFVLDSAECTDFGYSYTVPNEIGLVDTISCFCHPIHQPTAGDRCVNMDTTITVSAVPEPPAGHLAILVITPNPARLSTRIDYDVDHPGNVSLEVYGIAGQRVRSLVNNWQKAGRYSVAWDGVSDDGNRAGSGIYWVRMSSEGRSVSRKLILAR